jgi:hypothetical protein
MRALKESNMLRPVGELDKREEAQNARGRVVMARMDNWEVSTT